MNKARLTSRMTYAAYISQQIGRLEYFATRDAIRAERIRCRLERYVKDKGPSGSGIDCGTTLSDGAEPQKLVFTFSFHTMDEHGCYDGWIDYTLVVKPEFNGLNLLIKGRDKNGLKDHLYEVYRNWLTEEADHPAMIEAD